MGCGFLIGVFVGLWFLLRSWVLCCVSCVGWGYLDCLGWVCSCDPFYLVCLCVGVTCLFLGLVMLVFAFWGVCMFVCFVVPVWCWFMIRYGINV